MTNANLTYITGVLDRSGSMQSIRADAEGGWNAFVAEQASQPGECMISLVQFDEECEVVYDHVPAREITPYRLEPRGMTALLDAMGRAVISLGTTLDAMDEDARPGSVVVVIVTDGEENSSKEFTYSQIKSIVETQQSKYSWQFIYLGANQDAIDVGSTVGLDAQRSMSYAPDQIGMTMGMAAGKVSRYRAAKSAGVSEADASTALNLTDDERNDAKGE
jgi:uncharacterized protein YegL